MKIIKVKEKRQTRDSVLCCSILSAPSPLFALRPDNIYHQVGNDYDEKDDGGIDNDENDVYHDGDGMVPPIMGTLTIYNNVYGGNKLRRL